LMGVKNFGATSLDEVKDKLANFGLSLRQLD
jgi:DNA-directed RNA polymerase alpha subunit